MKAAGILALLKALGVNNAKEGNDWVQSSCPLGPYTHVGGADHNPSFGVQVTKGQSHFNCFVCEHGTLDELVSTFAYHWERNPVGGMYVDLKKAREILEVEGGEIEGLPDYEDSQTVQPFEEWPTWILDNWTPVQLVAQAMEYLTVGRTVHGAQPVSEEQAIAANLRWDADFSRIVAPFWNVYGRFAGARGRSTLPDVPKAYRHYDYRWQGRSNTKLVWYGEQALELEGPLIVVEGQFDLINISQVYPKVVANLTAKPSKQKMMKAVQSDGLLFMLDNDDTGQTVKEQYVEYAERYKVPFGVIDYPKEWKDPASVPPDWLHEELSKAGLV